MYKEALESIGEGFEDFLACYLMWDCGRMEGFCAQWLYAWNASKGGIGSPICSTAVGMRAEMVGFKQADEANKRALSS